MDNFLNKGEDKVKLTLWKIKYIIYTEIIGVEELI